MTKSMTGFGRGEAVSGDKSIVIEMKSVNHKFLDISIRMPRQFVALEEKIKSSISAKVSRGKVDVFITYTDLSGEQDIVLLNKGLAKSYYDAIIEISDELDIDNRIGADSISRYPEVLKLERKEEDLDEVWALLSTAVDGAVSGLCDMRALEGEALKKDLLGKKEAIISKVDEIAKIAPAIPLEYKEKLEKRISELMDDSKMVDADRLATEVAIFADKCSIDEELVRLNTHFNHMTDIFEEDGPIGRKLDFLLQEMNREINTIGSKGNNMEIAKYVVEIKSEFEKIREQIQNIE